MDPLQHPVFQQITKEEYDQMYACGCLWNQTYEKEEMIFRSGEQTKRFGIVLSGEVYIESSDLWGNRTILHQMESGGVFAETYAFTNTPLMVDVIAMQKSTVLFIDIGILLSPPYQDRSWYAKLIQSLLILSTNKNLAWSARVLCICAKSIRSRVMTYLSAQAMQQGSMQITIPFDRQQMADYLNVERSALSKELGKMQKEGILTFHKNQFYLHRLEKEQETSCSL